MKQQVAIKLMKMGLWFRHPYFSENEKITIEGDEVVTECGYKFPVKYFFYQDRNSPSWNKDWFIDWCDNSEFITTLISEGYGFEIDKITCQILISKNKEPLESASSTSEAWTKILTHYLFD